MITASLDQLDREDDVASGTDARRDCVNVVYVAEKRCGSLRSPHPTRLRLPTGNYPCLLLPLLNLDNLFEQIKHWRHVGVLGIADIKVFIGTLKAHARAESL